MHPDLKNFLQHARDEIRRLACDADTGAQCAGVIAELDQALAVTARPRPSAPADPNEREAPEGRHLTELRRSERDDILALVIEQSGDGIIMADAEGVLRIFNAEAERQHGAPRQEVRPADWTDTFGLRTLDDRPLPLADTPLYRAVRGERVENAGWLVRLPNREVRTLRGTATPLQRPDGTPAGAVLITRDVTAALAAERQLHEQAEALRRSNEDLEQFAAVCSHDLQTPLRGVANWLGLLRSRHAEALPEAAIRMLDHAITAATGMSAMLRDLLAFARVDQSRQPATAVALTDALDEALALLRDDITSTGARVTADGLTAVRVERALLVQLFQNLVGNALKFQRPDVAPVVRVTCEREGAFWKLGVHDNGIGISPEFHARIFVIFQRLHGRAQYPGNGIGLSICKKIVERHGGRLWVESQPGSGTTFFFTLPAPPEGKPA